MNTTVPTTANPFALMMDPQSVLAAIASSERLARLHSRVFRPLDKPLIAHVDDAGDADDEAAASEDSVGPASADVDPDRGA